MSSSTAKVKGPEDWQIDSDVRTLAEAEKIRGDKKRHGRAKQRAKEMIADLQTATGEGDGKPEPDGDQDD